MRELNKLSAAFVKSAPAGKHGDGGGLSLHKRSATSGKWIFKFSLHGKRPEMGLGPYPEVSLRQAREAATEARQHVREGRSPIKVRQKERREAERNLHLLKDIALDAFEARKAELKGDGKAGRWFTPLELHVLPKLGRVPVAEIDQIDIRNTLAPIWHEKADTAYKALGRLAICMKHAAALGLEVDLNATEKARALLGKQRHKITHLPALPWKEVPAFYRSLSEPILTHLAMRLLILTAMRSKSVRLAHLDQIEGDTWTIPAENMKSRKDAATDFRVPLSPEAQEVISEASKSARDGYLFPGVRKGVISDATMSRYMERREMEARPHGFRSSFRDWVAETTNTPHEVAETALGHVVGGSVERAYRRTDHLEQRRALMCRWADYVTAKSGEIVRFG
ncbi:tyrosine-type recombinase/integrase [Halocynthiibacter styelae]|uniref:Integrase arm-type DNA-binding domain-containing protein n=1 Tax=Halocynthiibacter styelae TaxID=2761955 RepID=A0A8J7J8C5_9RHOB|nr:site-specific integrase [Paenihalocynthiibacter styelae]MBI1495225.1 integrase arm-type DNA-binding domain-containing protein [Paenihalocynthiibacter styelae]